MLPTSILSPSLILSETVTPLQWLGTAIILAAIAFNELGTGLFRHRNKVPEDQTPVSFD
ncbi:hypothetical protein [Cytobacillus sp. FSL R5-0596]|uniref:hypothetical protein n=1 Tax=Cytobacillus sp. FSL R5-0596 TaxID=2954696 RepID=UPI0030F567EF